MTTPVSGPGQFSERTDKAVGDANATLPNAQYGENRDFQDQQAGAPMAACQGGLDFSTLFGNPADRVTPMGAETSQPNTPVTDGADAGPGAGSEVLSSAPDQSMEALKAKIIALEFMANQPNSSPSARNYVRKIKSML